MIRVAKWLGLAALIAVIGLVVAYWTPDTDPVAMRAKYGAAPSQFVDVGGGLTVHLRDEGPRDGRVIVLLHGSNADLHTWDPWTERLTKAGYRVVRFDQIGHGLTGPSPARDYSMAAVVGTVEAVATKLGLPRFTLAGNSMGGGVAWHYALAHPKRLDALVLVDASGSPVPIERKPPFAFRLLQSDAMRPVLLHITPRGLIASGVRSAFAHPALVSEATIDRYWNLLRYPGNRQATVDRQSIGRANATPAQLAALHVPTLILWGRDDQVLPLAGADFFARAIPGATKIVYPATGHIPMEEVADASAADVVGWLDRQLANHPPLR